DPERPPPQYKSETPGPAASLGLSPAGRLGPRAARSTHAARRIEPMGRLPCARSRTLCAASRARRAIPHVPQRRASDRSTSAEQFGWTVDVKDRRIAIITGGKRGIGLGIAHALARDGWHLALSGRRSEETV